MPQCSNVVILIPAHNEANRIRDVVLRATAFGNVVVVDDGSRDATGVLAKRAGAVVLSLERRRGKGYAVRLGIQYAVSSLEFRDLILLDGDGQHDPADIAGLLERRNRLGSDFVLGVRTVGENRMSIIRRLWNRAATNALSVLIGHRLRDSQCGFRLLSHAFAKKLRLCEDGYAVETEMICQAVIYGVRVSEIPVQTIYDDRRTKIRDIVRAFSMLRGIIRHGGRVWWLRASASEAPYHRPYGRQAVNSRRYRDRTD